MPIGERGIVGGIYLPQIGKHRVPAANDLHVLLRNTRSPGPFHLFEGGPGVKVRHHLLGRDRTLRSAQFSFGALGASCRLELSRLLNSVVGLRRPDESGSWPGQDWGRRDGNMAWRAVRAIRRARRR